MNMCSSFPSFWETLPTFFKIGETLPTIWEAPCLPAHHLGSTLLACPPFGKHPACLPTIWEAPCLPAHHLGSTLTDIFLEFQAQPQLKFLNPPNSSKSHKSIQQVFCINLSPHSALVFDGSRCAVSICLLFLIFPQSLLHKSLGVQFVMLFQSLVCFL